MKKYFQMIITGTAVFFLFFSIPMIGFTDDDIFYVIHVEGEVFHKESGKILKIRDELKNENEILFKSTEAWAVVISPEQGKLYICPDPKSIENRNKFIEFAKACLLPSRKNVSTRLIPDREEIAFLISVLKGMKKSEAEIKAEVLEFMVYIYYGESGETQAKSWLEKEFQIK